MHLCILSFYFIHFFSDHRHKHSLQSLSCKIKTWYNCIFRGHLAADLFFFFFFSSCLLMIHVFSTQMLWPEADLHSTLWIKIKMYFLSWTFTKAIRLSVSLEDWETERSMNYQSNEAFLQQSANSSTTSLLPVVSLKLLDEVWKWRLVLNPWLL